MGQQQLVTSNPDLLELLSFQEQFISLVHSEVYHHPENLADAGLRFEIQRVSEANQKLHSMVQVLSRQLIDQKMGYQTAVRDQFLRVLQSDFLPLLRINRYELTKLSLFGFDIYVEPLQAVLQILSRLEQIKRRILESKEAVRGQETAEAALLVGWDHFLYFADEWKASFNLYILQEYLRFGGKSFLKKDREILFTGISNLYSQLIPALAQRRNLKLLSHFAQLNTSLYNFHPSYNYFQFFTFLLPISEDLEPVFATSNQLLQKCLRTNILTPLLFGMLRHRESFLRFIEQVDSPIWLPYLNTIISGIAINLKFRILEYEEIIELFEMAVSKAGLLGTIRTDEISGTLEEGWKDAKDFFISAVKIGFDSGEVQTWKSLDFEAIGPRVINSVLDGMLVNPADNPQWEIYLESPEQKISEQLRILTEKRQDWHSIRSWISQLDGSIESEKQVHRLIRIANLIRILKAEDQYCLNFVINSLLSVTFSLSKSTQQRMRECIEQINQFLCSAKADSLTFIKDKVVELHLKYPPLKQIEAITKFYFKNYEPKKAFSTLLHIMDLQKEQNCLALSTQISLRFSASAPSKFVKMRTFEHEILVKGELVNTSYEGHCILGIITAQLITGHPYAQKLITSILSSSPWVAFSLINFPINEKGRLFSFCAYLIQHPQHHGLLKTILSICKGTIISEEGFDLIEILTFPSVCEQLYKKINQVDDCQELQEYADLLMWAYERTNPTQENWKDLLSLYLFLLERKTDCERGEQFVSAICVLAVRAFGIHLNVWIALQLCKLIEGKYDLHKSVRKILFKSTGSSIYFVNQAEEADLAILQQSSKARAKDQIKSPSCSQDYKELQDLFWVEYQKVAQMTIEQLTKVKDRLSMILQEGFRAIFIPELSEAVTNRAAQTWAQGRQMALLIGLNTDNYLRLVAKAVENANVDYLSYNRYIAGLNPQLSSLLRLQRSCGCNLLLKMCSALSMGEKQRIADELFLQMSSLSDYLDFLDGIEFISVLNSFNWRLLVDHLTKQLSTVNPCSSILEYNEYLTITNHLNQDYEQTINKHIDHFHKYLSLLSIKIELIKQQSESDQQLQLKLTNEFTFLKMVLSALQIYNLTDKLASLSKNIQVREIPHSSKWIEELLQLNRLLNQTLALQRLPKDFPHNSCLVPTKQHPTLVTEVSLALQNYYQDIGTSPPCSLHPQVGQTVAQP